MRNIDGGFCFGRRARRVFSHLAYPTTPADAFPMQRCFLGGCVLRSCLLLGPKSEVATLEVASLMVSLSEVAFFMVASFEVASLKAPSRPPSFAQ